MRKRDRRREERREGRKEEREEREKEMEGGREGEREGGGRESEGDHGTQEKAVNQAKNILRFIPKFKNTKVIVSLQKYLNLYPSMLRQTFPLR